MKIMIRKDLYEEFMREKARREAEIEKSNPNHDAFGRFTFGKEKLLQDTGLDGHNDSSKVQHKNGFVLTKSGSMDFGEITPSLAREIKRQAGKIRLQTGWQDDTKDTGSGELHIERPKRLKQLNQVGFSNARDFIENICNGYDSIFSSGASLMLVKSKDLFTCIVELTPNKDSDFYDVKTAYVSDKNNIRNKLVKKKIRLVWNSPTSLDLSKSLIPSNSKSSKGIPTGFIKGTSDTSNIPQSFKKSILDKSMLPAEVRNMSPQGISSYIFSVSGSKLHKSFDIEIADITESNREKKAEQAEKALNAIYNGRPFAVRHIPAEKNGRSLGSLVLRIQDFDRCKVEKAVHSMAFTLDTRIKSAKGEAFNYRAQEELTDRFVVELTEKTKELYSFLIGYLGLPEIRILRKSNLAYRGRILYSPETGEPIKQSEWKKFVRAVEDFLSLNYGTAGERIVLSAEALGRILARMSRTNSLEAVKKMRLDDMKAGRRNFDWISETAKNMRVSSTTKKMRAFFGEIVTDRKQQARIQAAIDSAAQRITRATDDLKNNIRQVVIDGIRNRESQSKVSQNLFDRCVGLNRDFQRIADTEIQNNVNEAYIKEEVYNTEKGEKVYFRRFEIADGNTCGKCRSIKGKIALYSDVPLESEKINDPYADYAIWNGKTEGVMPMGTLHPYCRGGWYRCYPELEKR